MGNIKEINIQNQTYSFLDDMINITNFDIYYNGYIIYRIYISEEIGINKRNASKDCDICHYWYFKDIGFKHEPYLFNGCYSLMQKDFRILMMLLLFC